MGATDGPAAVHYLPIATTVLAAGFAVIVFTRYRERGGTHLFWWGLGMVAYGTGTLAESATTLFGWHEGVFRAWYITGALLGGAPLAQGTAYLLFPRRLADRLTVALLATIAVATAAVLLTPVDPLGAGHRLTGQVFLDQRVRMFSPFINLYAAFLLIGGAVWSAWRYFRMPGQDRRMWANVLIAVGGLLPGIGGSFTRFGFVEVLYVTELIGLLLIFGGYRLSTGSSTGSLHRSGRGMNVAEARARAR